ncbi:MAG: hypothetical protein R3D44_14095 [Hyphomicrobiaceae bacterium]
MSRAPARMALLVVVLLALTTAARAADPPVPPGRDPGGVAIAVVGAGLDYRRGNFAARLARDGEGELIGWDFVDNDRRPYVAAGGFDPLAALLLAGSPARLLPIRVPAGAPGIIARALQLLDEMPARVVLLAADPGQPLEDAHLAQAARHLPRLLLVVPARIVASPRRTVPAVDPTGLLVVAAVASRTPADVAMVRVQGEGPGSLAPASQPDDEAAALVAALAARVLSAELDLSGARLRARILALAEPGPDGIPQLNNRVRAP